jgi:polyhydroxybutyrate depolymerase
MLKKFALAFLFLALSLSAHAGTLTEYTMVWNGITRTYWVYIPAKLAPNPAMLVVLHQTVVRVTPPPGLMSENPFERLSTKNGFVLVWPISSYNTRSHSWYWDAYFTDASFPQPPDDVGFIGSVINTLSAQYAVNQNQVFVTGFSSGAFMSQRLAIELSPQIAAIASASGQVELESPGTTNPLPQTTTPVSVLTLNGDIDTTVPYCGGPQKIWGRNWIIATLDQTTEYWRQANGCTDPVPQLCTDGLPTIGVYGLDATSCTGGVEVKAVREVGVGHSWPPGTEAAVWDFFSTHGRNAVSNHF